MKDEEEGDVRMGVILYFKGISWWKMRKKVMLGWEWYCTSKVSADERWGRRGCWDGSDTVLQMCDKDDRSLTPLCFFLLSRFFRFANIKISYLVVEILGETYEMVGVLWAEHQLIICNKKKQKINNIWLHQTKIIVSWL
jgi:hypothetical protein